MCLFSVEKVRLNICGIEFTISTEKTAQEAKEAAIAIENSIKSLGTDNNRVSTTLASIITALSYYDKMQEAIKEKDDAVSQIEGYKNETHNIHIENERMKEELRLIRSQLKRNYSKDTSPIPEQFQFTTLKTSGNYVKPSLEDIAPSSDNFTAFFEQKTEE